MSFLNWSGGRPMRAKIERIVLAFGLVGACLVSSSSADSSSTRSWVWSDSKDGGGRGAIHHIDYRHNGHDGKIKVTLERPLRVKTMGPRDFFVIETDPHF